MKLNAVRNSVRNLMHQYGFDGFVYGNTQESLTSEMSWVILDNKQVAYTYSGLKQF